MIDHVKLFCIVDDFWKNFEPQWKQILIQHKIHPPKRPPKLSISELITILVLFHPVGYRNFKIFYCSYVRTHPKREFSTATSYTRMLELKKTAIFPLDCLLLTLMGECAGISFIDSTSSQVCHVKRASSHRGQSHYKTLI